MRHDIRIERVLPYALEHVWRALTERERLASWLMENDFEPRLDHAFTFRMKPQRGWDGVTHCQVIELEPPRRVAYTYRSGASGEKTLSCAGVDSRAADRVAKNIFTELDTVLRFTLAPDAEGREATRVVLEHTGFRGWKLAIVGVVMHFGWRRVLKRLEATLATMSP